VSFLGLDEHIEYFGNKADDSNSFFLSIK